MSTQFINRLKSIMKDREHAKQIIMTTSYYDLFNGYKSVFMNLDDTFKPDTTIESIYIFSFIEYPYL